MKVIFSRDGQRHFQAHLYGAIKRAEEELLLDAACRSTRQAAGRIAQKIEEAAPAGFIIPLPDDNTFLVGALDEDFWFAVIKALTQQIKPETVIRRLPGFGRLADATAAREIDRTWRKALRGFKLAGFTPNTGVFDAEVGKHLALLTAASGWSDSMGWRCQVLIDVLLGNRNFLVTRKPIHGRTVFPARNLTLTASSSREEIELEVTAMILAGHLDTQWR